MDITMYHRKVGGQIKVWQCWVEGNVVHSKWGQHGGMLSVTSERQHAKRERGGAEVARDRWEKKVETKKKKGWMERLSAVVDTVQSTGMVDFIKPLPRSFAPAKPIKTYDPNEVAAWDRDDLLFIQRKRDGMRHYLVSDAKGAVKIYSSGKEDMTQHLEPLLRNFDMPPNTILDCELTCTTPEDSDQKGFLVVSGIARSLPDRARAQISAAWEAGHEINLFVFDVLWYEGEPVFRLPYEKRYMLVAQILKKAYSFSINYRAFTGVYRMPLVQISRTRLATLTQAIDLVKKKGWEGLVIWRKDQSTMVQVNGSPKRVNCWKVKPVKEEDVVATSFNFGKGKNEKVVGAFNIALYRGGKLVPMGNCGGGLDDKTRQDALGWTYPCVIQIEYDQVSEKGFRFPIFKRPRPDKKPKECWT